MPVNTLCAETIMTFGFPERTPRFDERRRGASRMKAFAEVWADPGGTALAIACKVLDISKTGAKLTELDAALPDDFVLHSAGAKYKAHVVWRRQKQLGVEFVEILK